jgi:hypothetical protein
MNIYSVGIVCMSVCAPKTMTKEEIEKQANLEHPTGISHGWSITEENFASGESNPCPCNTNYDRLHYLLTC